MRISFRVSRSKYYLVPRYLLVILLANMKFFETVRNWFQTRWPEQPKAKLDMSMTSSAGRALKLSKSCELAHYARLGNVIEQNGQKFAKNKCSGLKKLFRS